MEKTLLETVKQFFSAKEEVHKHWYSPVENFDFVSTDFYQMIEQELTARKIPGLSMTRLELSEGGLLSDKRVYLRLKRERLVFDICAAHFGTSYFFSFRFVELPLGMKPLDLLVFLIGFAIVFGLLMKLLGIIMGFITLLVLIGAGIYVMRNAVAMGLKDLDSSLLKTPVIGPLYEVFFRTATYYREDTRLMYLSTVNSITEMLVDEVTAKKGIKLVKRYERTPINGELYQPRTIASDAKRTEPPVEQPA